MADDYSPTIRDAARRLSSTGGRVGRLGGVIRDLVTTVTPQAPTSKPDVSGPPASGFTEIDGYHVVTWIADQVLWVRHRGVWRGQVTSGYRSVADQRTACRHVCGNPDGCPGRCAKPGTSNHQGKAYPGGAVDVSDYETFGREVAHYPHGTPVKNDLPLDRVHFSYSGH